jgi:fermentation-respiration switch protein FrsA (DUF1100 family)
MGWAARAAYGVVGVAAAALLFLLGGRLMLGALERQLIYFPSRVSKDAATPALPGAAAVEEVWLEAGDGARIHGLHARAPDAFADLLFFHGNAGSLYDRLDNVALLLESGFNVFIIDYHGYGKSEGTPSEEALYEDGRMAYRYLLDERGVDPARLVLFGRSLGSTIAVELGTTEAAGAIIIESGFTSARELAAVHYGWLPGMLLRSLSHEFDSISKVPRLRAPALYVHGDVDAIVPTVQGRRLYEASPEPKELYIIEGAGHNDTLYVGGAEYFRRLVEFVKRYVSTTD